jgi:hypothetical protein
VRHVVVDEHPEVIDRQLLEQRRHLRMLVTEARQILEQGLLQTPGDDRILGIIRKFDP